jgi:low molecular weight protein-tyrosine phosphatase
MQHSALARPRARTSVLFVCMGNVCRSPTAEGVLRALVARAGLAQSIAVDSAGTGDCQVGEPPDSRAIAHAGRRGYELPVRRARQIGAEDFVRFEWILAMDRHNLAELRALRPRDYRGHLGLFLDFIPESECREVPDPYHGGAEDFETVLDLAERGAAALLEVLRTRLAKETA